MKRNKVAVVALATVMPLLVGCKPMPIMAQSAPLTHVGIENVMMATRSANNVGLALPSEITQPTP